MSGHLMPKQTNALTERPFSLQSGHKNANYQPFRHSVAGEINLCEDIDAYEVNSTYRNSLECHITMMHGSLHKSFGAREEVRGSGTSIRQVMQDAAALASNASDAL